MTQDSSDKKESLNLLIYEYLIKNKMMNSAKALKEELKLGDINISDAPSSLSTWYFNFIETSEVRSGTKIVPDSLNRIEGIMLKLENEKQRFSRMKNLSSLKNSPIQRHPHSPAPRMERFPEKFDQQKNFTPPKNFGCQNILTEIKRIDLGIPNVEVSQFCSINNILITFSGDKRMYFYNLVSNEIEYEFEVQRRSLKWLKAREVGPTIFFAYSSDDYNVVLCRYDHGKKEDIHSFDFEIPIKSFCLSTDTLFILDDNNIKKYSFNGIIHGAYKNQAIDSIEWFGNVLLAADPNKICEIDPRTLSETRVITKGIYPTLKVKGDVAFIMQNDSIQAIDSKNMAVITSVKCALPIKDFSLLYNTIAVTTSKDLFYATDVIPLKSPLDISHFYCSNTRGLLVLSTDGIIVLFTKNSEF